MATLKVIGTSHISKDSVVEIRRAIHIGKPDIVAIELDKNRLYSLEKDINRKPSLRNIPQIGLQGYLFTLIGGWLQKKLGNVVGTKPGSDMLAAVKYAKIQGAEVALIDQDIAITLKRLSQEFGWKDKINLFTDMIKGVFSKKWRIAIDLRKVPAEEVVERLMDLMKERYKGLYRALVEERNEYMANQLYRIILKDPQKKIVVVVGEGHRKGLLEELQKIFKLHNQKYLS